MTIETMMIMTHSRIFILATFASFLSLALFPNGADAAAFLGPNPELQVVTPPFLNDYAKAQSGVLLQVDLDIPEHISARKKASASRLYINNLTLELKGGMPEQDHATTPLPQFTGLSSLSRTGPLGLETHAQGSFVSVKGTQTVPLEHGCWEMSWIMGRPAGSIVCAFELPENVSRNDAVLHAGRLYMNFPVFTKEGLEEMRLKKTRYEVTYKEHTDNQKAELEKVDGTSNLFMKAVHFRRAVAANEKASMMRTNAYESIPSTDDDLVAIGDGLMLYKKGSVWLQRIEAKKESSVREKLVGEAFLKN